MKTDHVIQYLLAQDETITTLLSEIGADNTNNAVKKLRKEREVAGRTQRNLSELIGAHGTDNWKNAVRMAQSKSRLPDPLPEWATVVPPSWSDQVRPGLYRHWLRVCEAHIRVVEKFLRETHYDDDSTYQKEIEDVRLSFIRNSPWDFVQQCSDFYHTDPQEEAFMETEPVLVTEPGKTN